MNIAKKKIYDVCVIGSGAAGGFTVDIGKIMMKLLTSLIAVYLLMLTAPAKAQDAKTKPDEKGFVALFDGKSLTGWKLIRGHGMA